MTDDLPKVITIGRLRFRRRTAQMWTAGRNIPFLRNWGGKWAYGLVGPYCDTPVDAYVAGVEAHMASLASDYHREYTRLQALLREAES